MQHDVQAERMKHAPLSGIRQIIDKTAELEEQGKKIIHLEIGEPDFDTPGHIVAAAQKALEEQAVHYGPITGISSLRQAIAQDFATKYKVSYKSEEIMITHGVAHGIFLAMMAYLNPGDEILVPSPGYLCYFTVPNIAGATAVCYPLRQDNHYQIELETMEQLITKNTKMILINSPSNPCGSILNQKSLEHVAKLAEKYDLLVISDEVYAEMTYEGKPFLSIASLPELRKRSIILNGFSKYYAMTGWRIGYIVCDSQLFDPLMRLSFYSISCPNTFIQYAAQAALECSDAPSKQMVQEYEKRRNYMVKALNQLPGCSCDQPDGAFYIFLNITGTGMTSSAFCQLMLDEAGVALTPGNVFGETGEGFVRVSYANSLDNLKEAIHFMKLVLIDYL